MHLTLQCFVFVFYGSRFRTLLTSMSNFGGLKILHTVQKSSSYSRELISVKQDCIKCSYQPHHRTSAGTRATIASPSAGKRNHHCQSLRSSWSWRRRKFTLVLAGFADNMRYIAYIPLIFCIITINVIKLCTLCQTYSERKFCITIVVYSS